MDDVVKDRKPIEALIPIERVELYRNDAPPRALATQMSGRDLAAISSEAAYLQMIEWAIRSPDTSVDKLKNLMDLYERRDASIARKAFDAAVASAKAQIPPITRNAKGHNDKKYADLSAIAKVVDPILGQHGLSYRFRTHQTDKISVTCILSHKDGHAEETTLCGPSDTTGNKNAIQAIGSTLTYLQRYSLVQMLGLAASEDDDGVKAGAASTISDEQDDLLRNLALEAKADMPKFLEFFKAESISDIARGDFDKAKNALEIKRKKAAHDSGVRS